MSNRSIFQFPTEIFHLIFDYLDPRTIIESIGFACKELHEMVNSYDRLKLDFSCLSNSESRRLAELFGVQPRSLVVGNGERFSQVNLLLSLSQFDQLIRLESLRLVGINSKEFDQFSEEVIKYRLRSLSIIFPYQTVEESHRMISLISSMIVPCALQRLDLNLEGETMTGDTVLKSVEIILRRLRMSRCTYEEYHRILSSCTNLKTLFIEDFSSTEGLNRTHASFVCSNYPQLTSLTLKASSLPLDELCFLVSFTPSLVHLQMTIRNCHSFEMVDGNSWEQLMKTRLFHLKNFQFRFSYETKQNSFSPSLQSMIKSFKTPFWLDEKQWIIICDYIFDTSNITLYTASLKINTNETVIRYTNISSNDHCDLIIQHDTSHSNDTFDEQIRKIPPNFTTLNLRGACLNDTGASFLADALKNNTMLRTLICRNEFMSMRGIQYIGDILRRNQTLTTLDYQCRTSDIHQSQAEMHPAFGMGSNSCSFSPSRSRMTSRCHIGGDPLDFPEDCYFQSSYSRYSNNHFERSLINESSLFQSNGIRPDIEVEYIANALIRNKVLKVLRLQSSEITKRGAEHLAYALKNNSMLITLDCHHNEIGSEGTQYLADALKINSTLTALYLSLNWIKSPGIKHLADALKINKTLTTLDLQSNSMDSAAIRYLSDALKINQTLTTLIVASNGLQSAEAKDLAEALQINHAVTIIDLRANRIDPLGAQHLASMLRNNQTLHTLILEHNSIGDEGTEHLAQALLMNKTLKTLNLSENKIGRSGAEHLLKAFDSNQTIIILQLEKNHSIDQHLLDLLNRSIDRNKEFLQENLPLCSN